ncbi:HNH endonuclease [Sinorhizobium medicae]|uniref:HNH endonuclease n=1 Tax=Sinorhizobium medicae TaxID=110321 RepID=UPI001296387C|nr:HNH endonuclease [Sinorhizobium medicae]MQX46586.1 HNH endonuclease [Sinorhizobium medicae]
MPRLRALQANISTLAPLVGYASDDADKKRRIFQPWRAWYNTAGWEDLRLAVFLRDKFTCQRTGELCTGTAPAPNSPVAHHKTPHRGNPKLFWDIDNIETVSKRVHDSEIQREEQAIPRGQWD